MALRGLLAITLRPILRLWLIGILLDKLPRLDTRLRRGCLLQGMLVVKAKMIFPDYMAPTHSILIPHELRHRNEHFPTLLSFPCRHLCKVRHMVKFTKAAPAIIGHSSIGQTILPLRLLVLLAMSLSLPVASAEL